MQILVDADACPGPVKEILFRVAERMEIPVTLIANKLLRTPPSRFIKALQVAAGFDVADKEIVRLAQAGDLVITADIALAADVIAKGGFALNPRGDFYTNDNIREYLTMRDFMDQLRSSGVETGGPSPFSQHDRHAFASALDRHLRQHTGR
jgi:uncharacterized protein YaiI (UPF0178 family)